MKKLLLIILAGGMLSLAKAQQRAQFSQYMTNKFIINPAEAGTGDWVDLKVGYRGQWFGLNDYGSNGEQFNASPTTFYFTGTMPIGRPHDEPGHHTRTSLKHQRFWHGAGVKIFNDRTNPTSSQGFYGTYAYNMKIGGFKDNPLRISFGLEGGTQIYRVDMNMLRAGDDDDPALFRGGQPQSAVPDLAFGTWLYNRDFYLGVSGFNLLYSPLAITDTKGSRLNGHYFLTGGVNFEPSPEFSVIPSVLIKTIVPAPASVDINVKVKYKPKEQERFWGGLSYRSMDALVLLAGTTIPFMDSRKHINGYLDIGYSYDINVSKLNPYNNGTHEIVIGYRFPLHYQVLCASKFW